MAAMTNRFGLDKPDPDDYYDIDSYNGNLEKLDTNAVKGVGAAVLQVITAEAFAALSPAEDTLYIVMGSSDFTLYLGSVPLNGGSSAESLAAQATATPLTTGTLVSDEVLSGTGTEVTETEE